jgi:geranylgeranyl reductase family protein
MTKYDSPRFFDVIIIGAGPAGLTCALSLAQSELQIGLIDAASFPRDKICGDAIPGRAISVLRSISSSAAQEVERISEMNKIKRTGVFINHSAEFEIRWENDAFTCPRYYFDEVLMDQVRQKTDTTIIEGVKIDFIERKGNKVLVGCEKSQQFWEASLIIGGDGTHSIVSKKLTANKLNREDYVAAVRGYFDNVEGMTLNKMEVYLNKKFLPGYFWVFPLSEGKVNAGFGMLSSRISEKKINLNKAFFEFIQSSPVLTKKFKESRLIGKIQGAGLPLGSSRVEISGDNFMTIGDAAALIDPITGDGIGNAMLSGKLAAEQAITCFEMDNFSDQFLKQYERQLFSKIGKELTLHTRALRFGTQYPWVLSIAGKVMQIPMIKNMVQKML